MLGSLRDFEEVSAENYELKIPATATRWHDWVGFIPSQKHTFQLTSVALRSSKSGYCMGDFLSIIIYTPAISFITLNLFK